MTTYRPPGLSDREKESLTRLAKKESLTDMEIGQLSWFAFAGNREESHKAKRAIARHKKQEGKA